MKYAVSLHRVSQHCHLKIEALTHNDHNLHFCQFFICKNFFIECFFTAIKPFTLLREAVLHFNETMSIFDMVYTTCSHARAVRQLGSA